MRVVHVEDYFDPTAGYQINEILNLTKNFNHEIYLITSNDMSPFHKKVNKEEDLFFEKNTGVKIIRLDSRLKISSRLMLKGLWKEIDNIKPNLVFLHGIGDFKDLQLYGRNKEYNIVRDCHMSWIASKNKFAKMFYLFFKIFFAKVINKTNKYKMIFALGVEEYEYLKALGINDEKIEYLYHGYNDEIMYYDYNGRKEVRNLYNFNENDIVISYIGKFDDAKKPHLLVDIINKLDSKFIDNYSIKLLFIGSKNREYMNIFNKKLQGIDSKIEYIIDDSKPFNELRKYFSASDICIFPKETTLSSIHAQVCGCSVVMENHKSNMERVIDSSNLYPIDDIEYAAKIVGKLIDDRSYYKDNNKDFIEKIKLREYKIQLSNLYKKIN